MMNKTMTKSELADLLGVSKQQIWAWHSRRTRNGFPDRVGVEERRRGVLSDVFSPREVLLWWRRYVPSQGGRPSGRRAA